MYKEEILKNNIVISNEYDDIDLLQKKKSLDELISSINDQEKISKFNFAQSQNTKNLNLIKKYMTWFVLSVFIFVVGTIIFAMPLFTGNAEILPINPNPSNEVLSITSRRSSFYVNYNNQYFYANNINGVWTIELPQITGKANLKIGNFVDFGGFKINSSHTQSIDVDRNFKPAEFKTNLKKYYKKLTNTDKVLYETNGNNNICEKSKEVQYQLKCNTFFDNESKTKLFDLKLQDSYGNISTLQPKTVAQVPVNDFTCDLNKIYTLSKVYCNGSKDGKVFVNNKEINYNAKSNLELPIILKDGQNKYEIKMIDNHDFESKVNLDFMFDKTPLNVALDTKDKQVIATSNKDLTKVSAEINVNYINILSSKVITKDWSSKFNLTKEQISNEATPIMNSEITISKDEFVNPKNTEMFQSGSVTFSFQDFRGKTYTKACIMTPKEEGKKYVIKLGC
jgi:hypothetical protein